MPQGMRPRPSMIPRTTYPPQSRMHKGTPPVIAMMPAVARSRNGVRGFILSCSATMMPTAWSRSTRATSTEATSKSPRSTSPVTTTRHSGSSPEKFNSLQITLFNKDASLIILNKIHHQE